MPHVIRIGKGRRRRENFGAGAENALPGAAAGDAIPGLRDALSDAGAEVPPAKDALAGAGDALPGAGAEGAGGAARRGLCPRTDRAALSVRAAAPGTVRWGCWAPWEEERRMLYLRRVGC